MPRIAVIASARSGYFLDTIENLTSGGLTVSAVFLGSKVERTLFKLQSLRRITAQLGSMEALKRIIQSHRESKRMPYCRPRSLDELTKNNPPYVCYYDRVNADPFITKLMRVKPDIVLLAGCGIVDAAMLSLVDAIFLNAHPAFLPGLRGVDVIDWAVHKQQRFGVSVHIVTESVDAGAIVSRRYVDPLPNESYYSFKARMLVEQASILAYGCAKVASHSFEYINNPVNQSELCLAMPSRQKTMAGRLFNQRFV